MSNEEISKRLELKGSYFNLDQVGLMYEVTKGNRKGITKFLKDCKEISVKDDRKKYHLFKDEVALWKVFQKYLGEELRSRRINSWSELMQFLP